MRVLILSLLFCIGGNAAAATDLYIYPNNGQDQEKQRRDRYECHVWASQQSGFDPSTYQAPLPVRHTYPGRGHHPYRPGINPITGAAGGAALGAVGGAIGGDAGKGAAIGAGVGALAGAFHTLAYQARARDHEEYRRRQADRQVQQAEEIRQLRSDYNRAISACLEGRGYTVK
ncbi:MAG: glycine zipper family protein [Gammaproteobacteria bacterium]